MTTILFDSLFPITWTAVAAMLTFLLLSWLEIKRKQKLLIVRLIALFLAIISICGLILNPALTSSKSSAIVILTPGFDQTVLDSLTQQHPERQLYKLHGVEENNSAIELENYRKLNELRGNLMVLGEGVPLYMLEYLDTTSLQFFPGTVPPGITEINPFKIYHTNQASELSGTIHATGIAKIKLVGPGIAEDSVTFGNTESQQFSFRFTSKASGLYPYTIIASDRAGTILSTERVPVQVQDQKSLSILFLTDYPTAEIRFLKNFLESQGHKLILRYSISKNKYHTEFINTAQKTIGTLNSNLLNAFDLIITDASSLNSFNRTEVHEIQESIKQGLGLLTIINSSSLTNQANDLLAIKLTPIKNDSVRLNIGKQIIKLPATQATVSSEKKLFAIQQEASGRITSGYYSSGLGRSGFQLLTNTFSLQLAGEKEIYGLLWTELIESLARMEIKKYDVHFTTPFPYHTDEPVEFKIIAAGEKPVVKMDSVEIQLIEDPLIQNVWYGKIWAGASGWNQLQILQDSSQHNFFVSQPTEWKSLQIFNQQKIIQRLESQKKKSVHHTVYQPISKAIFYILFLISAGFLWLAPKL